MSKENNIFFSNMGIGISRETFLETGGIDTSADRIAYVSGSLVEGYGNSLSDIDIFVISKSVVRGEIFTEKKEFSINIIFYNGRRLDYEFWEPAFIFALAAKLSGIRIGEEFVAEKLSPSEELFIHRLKKGLPLDREDEFAALQKQFDFEHFRKYLVQQCIHMIDGALDDITGYTDDNDLNTAVFRCVVLAGLATDLYCYHNNCTNTLPKWREKKLQSLAGKEKFDYVYSNFWKLSFPRITPAEDYGKQAFIEEAVVFTNSIVEFVQS